MSRKIVKIQSSSGRNINIIADVQLNTNVQVHFLPSEVYVGYSSWTNSLQMQEMTITFDYDQHTNEPIQAFLNEIFYSTTPERFEIKITDLNPNINTFICKNAIMQSSNWEDPNLTTTTRWVYQGQTEIVNGAEVEVQQVPGTQFHINNPWSQEYNVVYTSNNFLDNTEIHPLAPENDNMVTVLADRFFQAVNRAIHLQTKSPKPLVDKVDWAKNGF
jgi:hypothetical protein